MFYRTPPRIAVINSFAGYGRCSLTEVLPVISVMGVQACPLPTAVFSSHSGFSSFYRVDFTAHMEAYLAEWERLGLVFDGIYCGFLGTKEQIAIVSSFLHSQRKKGCSLILVDPVMGDNGKLYTSVSPSQNDGLRQLVGLADIITPNFTEACLLARTTWEEYPSSREIERVMTLLHQLGPDKIVITGLREKNDGVAPATFVNYTFQKDAPDPNPTRLAIPSAGMSRHGTGDIFAAILAADALLGQKLQDSVRKASEFIAACIQLSDRLHIPECEGVCFENLLDMLLIKEKPQ